MCQRKILRNCQPILGDLFVDDERMQFRLCAVTHGDLGVPVEVDLLPMYVVRCRQPRSRHSLAGGLLSPVAPWRNWDAIASADLAKSTTRDAEFSCKRL